MQPIGFMPNSTTLTPAFTPEMVLSSGTQTGQLGGYLGSCNVMGPQAPCNGLVAFGPLLSNLTGQSASQEQGGGCYTSAPYMTTATTTGVPHPSGTMTASPTVATYTGDASKLSAGAGVVALALAIGWIMV